MKEVIKWKKGKVAMLYNGKNYSYAYCDELSMMLLAPVQNIIKGIDTAFAVKNFKTAKEIVRLLEL